MSDKLEINKKLLGKSVRVLIDGGQDSWIGTVSEVVDECTFLVISESGPVRVDIFDIRSLS